MIAYSQRKHKINSISEFQTVFLNIFLCSCIWILLAKVNSHKMEKCQYLDGCSYMSVYEDWEDFTHTDLQCKIDKSLNGRFNFEAYNRSIWDECGLNTDEYRISFKHTPIVESSMNYVFEILKYVYTISAKINFKGIKGVNMQSPVKLNTYSLYYLVIEIENSNFNVFDSQNKILTTCQDFNHLNMTGQHLFSWNISQSILWSAKITFLNTRFKRPICELVFKHTSLKEIDFGRVYESFFKKSIPQFIEQSKYEYLNSSFDHLKVDSYEIILDSRILNKKIFQNLSGVEVLGRLDSIQYDIFIPFKKLTSLYFEYLCFERLTKTQSLDWMRSINTELYVNLSNSTQIEESLSRLCAITVNIWVDRILHNSLKMRI